jgi:hypothetical protein
VLAHEIEVREVQRDSRRRFSTFLEKPLVTLVNRSHLHTRVQVLPRPGTGIPFPIVNGGISPRLGY